MHSTTLTPVVVFSLLAVAAAMEAISTTQAQSTASQWMVSSGGNENFQKLKKGPPLSQLGFGDFDGDGKTDVFFIGAVRDDGYEWMYSPGGTGDFKKLLVGPRVEVRYLRFGDFDGDRKTDVLVQQGSTWMYSSGGNRGLKILDAQPLRVGGELPEVATLMFGDFDEDGKTDVFSWVPGDSPVQWVFWSGGTGRPQKLGKGYPPVAMGDFDRDGKTDAFVPPHFLGEGRGSQWMYSPGAAGTLINLAVGPGARLRFGDFDGDGKTDVFHTEPLADGAQWMFSSGGNTSFQNLAVGPSSLDRLAFGDFDGDGKTDVFVAD
jgi:hypothetical protein